MSFTPSSSIITSTIASTTKASSFNNIKELEFLSYYPDFKLILCSICSISIIPSAFKSHLNKHIKLYKKEKQHSILTKALDIFNSLEVTSLKESLNLINIYSKSISLVAFKELKVKDLFICTSNINCSLIFNSKYRIKRHIRENHSSSSFIDSKTSFYKVIKGQSLENYKFSFEISLTTSIINSSITFNRTRSNSPSLESIEQAKQAFLTKYSKKEKSFNKELNSFKLNSKEKLSPFQIKTRYIEYINKYNI